MQYKIQYYQTSLWLHIYKREMNGQLKRGKSTIEMHFILDGFFVNCDDNPDPLICWILQ